MFYLKMLISPQEEVMNFSMPKGWPKARFWTFFCMDIAVWGRGVSPALILLRGSLSWVLLAPRCHGRVWRDIVQMSPVFMPSPNSLWQISPEILYRSPHITWSIIHLYFTSNFRSIYFHFYWWPSVDEASIIPMIQMWKLSLQWDMWLIQANSPS